MHTLTIVLLPRATQDLREAATELFLRHHIDHHSPELTWRLDYWSLGDENIADEFTANALNLSEDEDEEDLYGNVCFVSRLSPEFIPGAIVTPEGTWHDLIDFGWGLEGEALSNQDAEMRWRQQVWQLFAAYRDHVAVEFDTHS